MCARSSFRRALRNAKRGEDLQKEERTWGGERREMDGRRGTEMRSE
jgi:hypothetical protein